MRDRKSFSVFPELVSCEAVIAVAAKQRANARAARFVCGARMRWPAFFAASVLPMEALALALAFLTVGIG